jgi:hypothetical protein
MGHVERRVWSGKASYRARYRDPTGRERSKSFRRKADAERWLNASCEWLRVLVETGHGQVS